MCMPATCRCGWRPTEDHPPEHPCHAKAYQCRKPARQRFYNARPVALSGMQMKLQVTDTWACDECWAEFQAMVKVAQEDGKVGS